jgi:hypothetical protein
MTNAPIRDIAVSWVLYAIRETVGLTIVRNAFLRKKINKLGKYNPDIIQYGKTFSCGDTFEDIYEMIYDFHGSDKRFLIFTSNGEIVKNKRKRMRPSSESELVESHYVSFILDRHEMTVTMIDPSRNNGKIGIYNPYIGIYLEPFFKKQGYTVEWLEMTSPCQVNYHDVFCQSWTMFLVYKWLKYGDKEKIYIPKSQYKKYTKLLKFFKELLDYDSFRNELRIAYAENIKDHEDFCFLNEYDPCILLLEMTPMDMNDEI